jgi:hypothetical protein
VRAGDWEGVICEQEWALYLRSEEEVAALAELREAER